MCNTRWNAAETRIGWKLEMVYQVFKLGFLAKCICFWKLWTVEACVCKLLFFSSSSKFRHPFLIFESSENLMWTNIEIMDFKRATICEQYYNGKITEIFLSYTIGKVYTFLINNWRVIFCWIKIILLRMKFRYF